MRCRRSVPSLHTSPTFSQVFAFINIQAASRSPIQISPAPLPISRSPLYSKSKPTRISCPDPLLNSHKSPQVNLFSTEGISDFAAQSTAAFYLSIKPYLVGDGIKRLNSLNFAIRTEWKYTTWKRVKFSFIAEERPDIEANIYQI